MNDLYFTGKNKKGLEGQNYPGKQHKFNEILLCRMKSEWTWMKSSVCHFRWNQIRLFLTLLARFHRVAISSTKWMNIINAEHCISSKRSFAYHHCESDTTYGWWDAPSVMIYTLKRDDIPLLSQWIKKTMENISFSIVFLSMTNKKERLFRTKTQ